MVDRKNMTIGRPTRYKEEYADQARKLCLLGSTDAEMSDFFEVCEATLNTWKQAYPEFLESIKRGKSQADANVADRLYQRAMGYEHPEVHITSFQGTITVTPITKVYAPDPTASIFWLKNRQRGKWRDRVETEHSGTIGVSSLSNDALAAKIAAKLAALNGSSGDEG